MHPAANPKAGQFRAFSSFLALGILAFAAAYGVTRVARNPTTAARPALPMGQSSSPQGMVWIPGGVFRMGTDDEQGWDDERPAHRVRVDDFWIDATEVTNAQFREFVDATEYVTTAEKTPKLEDILAQSPPGTPAPAAELMVPGSVVFTPPNEEVPLNEFARWWSWTPGASWRHPEGPDSDLEGRDEHPVVHVSWDDAAAYAEWAGKRLPTEAEWELAARGGLDGATYAWGTDAPSVTKPQANLWTGEFPHRNTVEDGYVRTAPVKSFPANGYGLYDMAGNVWEWCSDWYDREAYGRRSRAGITDNPRGPEHSIDPHRPYQSQRTQRGGSFMCHDSYCTRYRPSARHGCTPDTGMSHVGFRCAMSAAEQ